MALYVRGGDKLSAQSQSQVSIVATRKLPVLVGGVWSETTRWCYPVLITSIDPGDHSADVEAVNYDVRVYADDDNFAPT